MTVLPSLPSLHPHPDRGQLELYVLGALDGEGNRRLERHVRICDSCACRLREEARLENTLRAAVGEDAPGGEVERPLAKIVRLPARRPAAPIRRHPGARSRVFAAAAALLIGAWGLGNGRLVATGPRRAATQVAALVGDGVLVCELGRDDLLCPMPLSASTDGPICRAPAMGACPNQSRMP